MLDMKLLERLCKCDGLSGDEGEVRELIIEEIKPYADSITVDNLGHLIVHKQGKNRAKSKLMLSAHIYLARLDGYTVISHGEIYSHNLHSCT